MTTPAPGERRRHRRWPWIAFAALAVLVIWSTLEFVDDDHAPAAFASPALEAVVRPWRRVIGSCTPAGLAHVRASARCEARAGDNAPIDLLFTLYASEAQRERDRVDTGGWFLSGPRSGGFLMAGAGRVTWEHGTRPVTVEVEWDQEAGAEELDVLAWWDTHAPAVAGASSSPSPLSDGAGPTAKMSVPLREFSAPWHGDLRRCARVRDGGWQVFTSDLVPTAVGTADERVVCELRGRSGWRRTGGFEQILFLRWNTITAQHVHREHVEENYGKARDRPGVAGPESGHFLAASDRGQCVVYWDDEAVAVAAVAVTHCSRDGRPTRRTLATFWESRHR